LPLVVAVEPRLWARPAYAGLRPEYPPRVRMTRPQPSARPRPRRRTRRARGETLDERLIPRRELAKALADHLIFSPSSRSLLAVTCSPESAMIGILGLRRTPVERIEVLSIFGQYYYLTS
jgi:hypothetical protein